MTRPTTEAWLPKPMQIEATRLIVINATIEHLRKEVKAMEEATNATGKPAGTTDLTAYYKTQAALNNNLADYADGLAVWKTAYLEFVSAQLQIQRAELRNIEENIFQAFPPSCHPREALIISPAWQNQRAICEATEARTTSDAMTITGLTQSARSAQRDAQSFTLLAAREPQRYKDYLDNRKAEEQRLASIRAKRIGDKTEREAEQQTRISALLGKQ